MEVHNEPSHKLLLNSMNPLIGFIWTRWTLSRAFSEPVEPSQGLHLNPMNPLMGFFWTRLTLIRASSEPDEPSFGLQVNPMNPPSSCPIDQLQRRLVPICYLPYTVTRTLPNAKLYYVVSLFWEVWNRKKLSLCSMKNNACRFTCRSYIVAQSDSLE